MKRLSTNTIRVCLTVLFGLFSVASAFAQNDFLLKVQDSGGKPLSGVGLYVGKSFVTCMTDADGLASFHAGKDVNIIVEKEGYKRLYLNTDNLPATVTLDETLLYGGADDIMNYPHVSVSKRNAVSADIVIKGSDLKAYPTHDLRNALVGLIPGLDVVEKNGSPTFSVMEQAASDAMDKKVSLSMRGYTPVFIIDGLEVDITEMPLDPEEIETITFTKGVVGKTIYGPRAAGGIINVETKRGRANVRDVRVNVETGISMADRFPEWVSGEDYAKMNNIARTNSGMDPLYSEADIAAYAKKDAYDLSHPNVNYRDMLWKNNRSTTKANVSSRGGNEWVKYFAYLGFDNEGDNFKTGPTANNNRITARSNLDINVTKALTVQFGIYAGLTIRNAPNYGSSSSSEMMNSLFSDYTTIPSIAFPVYAKKEEGEQPWYAVSSLYSRNPVGNLESCGYFKEQTRSGAANIAINYDFARVVPGLVSKTFFTFNVLNMTRIGKDNDYAAYIVSQSDDPLGGVVYTKVRDASDAADQSKMADYYYQRFAFNQKFSYDRTFGNHSMQLALIYSLFNGTKGSRRDPVKQQSGIFNGMYFYKNKLSADVALNFAGSSSFAPGKRYALFPSVGLGWIISEEPFMKGVSGVDFLKLHVNGGMLGYDGLGTSFYYEDRWSSASATSFGPHSANQWFGSSTESVTATTPNRISSPDLTWEKRKEFAVGVDALFFNKRLSVSVEFFDNFRDGVISKIEYQLPLLTGYSSASPWMNYGKYRYFGPEAALSWSDKVGDFRYKVGGNLTFIENKVLKYDEPNYREDYRYMKGQRTDAIMGYTYIGKYATDEEAQAVNQNFDQTLHAGDLKYADLNGDGIIDSNDISCIGNSTPKLFYGIQLNFAYKNFALNIVGNGRALYDINKSNIYYRNGTGDNNYSKYVLENMDGAYPRLTYQKVNNNFVTSGYWLEKGGFFKIQNVELSYTLPLKKSRGVDFIRFNLRGANLATISRIKDLDPESINAGVTTYPLCRTITIGLELSFK